MINYRLARRDDVATIQRLLQALAASLCESDLYGGSENSLLHHGFCENPCFEVLLAFNGAQAVGLCLYFREYSTWRGKPGVYIQDLYVNADVRGQSIGKTLLQKVAVRSASRWQCDYLRLSVHDSNHTARVFYKRLGLTPDTDNDIMKLVGDRFQRFAAPD